MDAVSTMNNINVSHVWFASMFKNVLARPEKILVITKNVLNKIMTIKCKFLARNVIETPFECQNDIRILRFSTEQEINVGHLVSVM